MKLRDTIVFFIKRIKSICINAATGGDFSPEVLAWSFSAGIYIAFSPFPGLHTVMVLITRLLFRCNVPILFFSTSINNPWTMIPFFSFDYFFGHWLVHTLLGFNPGMVVSLEKVGLSGTLCLWSFLIGGNVLGIVGALISYPIMKKVFTRLASIKKQPIDHNENYSEEQKSIS